MIDPHGMLQMALGALLRAGITMVSKRSLPQTTGTLSLDGLHSPAEVIRDRWGIPHIYARDLHDLLFAQGFTHAQDRLFQMDFQRRLVSGRLSEVAGPATLSVDRWIRILSMRHAAETEAKLLDGEVRSDAEAYCAGVNACMEKMRRDRRLPVEFLLLRYTPEPWTPADSISWLKFMSWVLSINWETELIRARLVDHLGADTVAQLEPDYSLFERWPTIVPAGVDYSGLGAGALEAAAKAREFTGPGAGEGVGSNNWALSGERTVSGKPLFANDMHLSLTLPAVWYQNHLSGGDLDVIGVSLPGIPYVVAGHNGHVAWGFTDGFADVQDLYMERLRRTASGEVEYEYRGEWLPAEVRTETVRVHKGRRMLAVKQRVIVTRHGQVINSLATSLAGDQPLALRWVSLEASTGITTLRDMNRARNCAEFREALRRWVDPVLNAVYTDTEGNIAYSLIGKVPLRAGGNGRLPVPGWSGEYEWTGYIPFDELPHRWNPVEGRIVTANNRVVGDDYPHFISLEYAGGDRGQRITELLEERERSDVEWSKRVQLDHLSPSAREMRDYLAAIELDEVDDPDLNRVQDLFRTWDGTLSPDSVPGAVYEIFVVELLEMMLAGRLGDLASHYAGKGPTEGLAGLGLFGLRAREWLLQNMADPASPWFDLGGGERRDAMLRLALRSTVHRLRRDLGPDPDRWSWGRLHKLTFGHPLGSAKLLAPIFNRGSYPIGGDLSTVWASVSPIDSEQVIGPPFRFVADLSDLRHSVATLAPGQSGQVGSKHYDDGIRPWFEGDYHPLLYAREDVEREAEAHLRIVPNSGPGAPDPKGH